MNIRNLLMFGFVALAVGATPDGVWAGTATPESIIVMPARKRVVHLAFQIAHCKDIGLVSYNSSPNLASPLIHVWNGQEWVQISVEDYQQGTFMSGEPRHVFILGNTSTLPPQIASTPDWAKNAEKITSLDTANLVNTIGKVLKFSPSQWKWLAEANALSIEDQNAERRRYGRWGAPGKEVDLSPVKKLETTELPPPPIAAEPVKGIKAEALPAKTIQVKPEVKDEPVKTEPVAKSEAKVEIKPEAPAQVKVEAPKNEPVKVESKAEAPAPLKAETPKKVDEVKVTAPVPPVVEKPVTVTGTEAKPAATPKAPEAAKAPEAPVAK